jgi:hypothetical protein
MIPEHLLRAFQDEQEILLPGGAALTRLRRLADLVLPSGRILIGYPGAPMINEPSPVRPEVPPGRYPVFATLAQHPGGYLALAFVAVRFDDAGPAAWEDAGSFFTDSGTGCLMDQACVPLLAEWQRQPDCWQTLMELKMGVFTEGDCNLVLEPRTGANAIVFRTYDARYPAFLGKDARARTVCLVIDCR